MIFELLSFRLDRNRKDNKMKKINLAILLVLNMFLNTSSSYGQLEQINIPILVDSIVKQHLTKYNIPSCIVSVVHQGKNVFSKGYGYSNLETKASVDPELSLFRVASITKTFTCLAILDLVDQGKLNLQTDIRNYFPAKEFPMHIPKTFSIHHIMTHTTGIEYSDFRISQAALEDGNLETFVKTSIPNQVYDPGSIFSYSNQAFSMLGLLIEKQTGQKYEAYMDQFIRDKFNMTNSTFFQHTIEHPISNATKTYHWTGTQFEEREHQFVRNPSASTLQSTATDMAKFMTSMMSNQSTNGKLIISPELYNNMMSYQFTSAIPTQGIGYGIFIDETKGRRTYNHGGGIRGYLSGYQLIPEEEIAIFISQSTRYGNEGFMWEVIGDFWDQVLLDNPKSQSELLITSEIENLGKSYEGLYQLKTSTQSTFEKGQLIFGTEERNVQYIGNGLLNINGSVYKPIDKGLYQIQDTSRNWQMGFTKSPNKKEQYMGWTLYGTLVKIPWFKSQIAIQIATGIGLFVLILMLLSRWISSTFNFTNKSKLIKTINLWQWSSALSMLVGFSILILMYVLELEADLVHGAHWGYKIGLAFTTLGGISSLFSPFALGLVSTRKELTMKTKVIYWVFALSLLLIAVVFWYLNLIGPNYY